MNTIKIHRSKKKLILLLLASLMFIFLGGWLAINPDKFVSVIFRNAFFIQVAGIVAIIFSGFCLIILLRNIFTNKFNLIINEKGIIDNSSYVGVGMIFWDDITSIKRIDVMSTKFLMINVKDPEKYINTQSNIKKKLLQRNLKAYGSPISISSNTLTCSFDELEKIILKYYNENKH
ncbi:STM3941 family protein [Chryseobacterium gossypii]|uniref:STM3941 family protein n=1 Tax=Chryseobacterium gossypii TaxID=3231602 RepID=UPI00352479A7